MLLRVKPVLTFLIAALVFFLIAEFISFKLLSSRHYTTEWRGYYQFVCKSEDTYREAETLLRKNGINGVISENSEKVSVFSYNKVLELPLSDVSHRFVSSDPLFDPYLKKIDGFFRGTYNKKPVKVLYLPIQASPLRTYLTLKNILKPIARDWIFISFIPFERGLLFFLVLTGEFVLYKLSRDKKIFFITLVAWFLPLVNGGFFVILSSMSFQVLWIVLLNRFIPFFTAYLNYAAVDRDEVVNMIIETALYFGVCVSMMAVIHGVVDSASILLPQTVQFFGTAAVFGYLFIMDRYRAHKLFSPVLIQVRWKCLKFNEIYAVLVFLILFLAAPLIYWVSFGRTDITVPEPYKIAGNIPLSFSGLQKLYVLRPEDSLPDLSDFLSHKAFLESYPYGGLFTFPAKGSEVSLPVFYKQGNLAFQKNSTIKLFTDSWYNRIISSVNNATVPGMLLKQRTPVGVKFTNVVRLSHSKGNLRKYYLFFVFLMFPFLFWAGLLFTSPGVRIKRLFLRRRRQVV